MITYQFENVKMPKVLYRRQTTRWLRRVAALHGKDVGNIGYVFCDDPKILEVNRQFLHHDYYTDVITFDYSENNVINGDIYISLDTVKSNSEKFQTIYEEELHRVIVHGLLHLCGIDDKGPGEREIMEREENAALAIRQEGRPKS